MRPAISTRRPVGLRARRAFTLAETMVALTLLGIVGATLLKLLGQQQRFYRSATEVIDARSQLRQAASLLPADLRGVSSSGGDIYPALRSDTSVTMLANFGSSVACTVRSADAYTFDLPPVDAALNTYTSWYTTPQVGDSVLVYDEGAKRGAEDDRWIRYEILTFTTNTGWCTGTGSYLVSTVATTGDVGKNRYRVKVKPDGKVVSATGVTTVVPDIPTTVQVGAVIRFARPVQYDLYQTTTDKKWYLGYREVRSGGWTTRQVVSGPYRAPASGSTPGGLSFRYYKDDGVEASSGATSTDTVARIDVTVRALGVARGNEISKGSTGRFQDSLSTRIAVRNRT